MKKYLLLILITVVLFNCAKFEVLKVPERKSILEIEDDSEFLEQSIKTLKKNKFSERELIEIAERTMVLTILTDSDKFEIAKKHLLKYENKFFSALSINSIVWKNKDNESVFKKTNELIEIANKFTHSQAFADSGLAYFNSRGYTVDEQVEYLSSYRGMIRDTYAFYLKKQGKTEEAIDVYEIILSEYQEAGIFLNYASVLNKMNRYQNALEASIMALRMTPGSEEVKDSLRIYAKNLVYSENEINAIIGETIRGGRSELKEKLLSDRLDMPMPAFEITSLKGGLLNSKEMEGKILIVDFWATWCGPCRKEFPHLNELVKKYSNDDEVKFVAISTDRDKEKVAPFIEKYKYEIPIYFNNNVSEEFGVQGIPSLFIIDKKGIIRYKKVGFTEGEEFDKIMGWYIESLR